MGIPFFFTFIDKFLFSTKNPSKLVNLKDKNVIIDGYSFFYFVYNQIWSEDQQKLKIKRETDTPFAYDGLWKKLRNNLKHFKANCATLLVVFDGVFKVKQHLRDVPERASSVKFEDSNYQLPSLIREEFMSILHELEIDIHVAPAEADPVVVNMARKHDAYVVALDTDYYLYEIKKGYVPLSQLALLQLEAQCYQMTDVFQRMTPHSVALWATAITYDFIDLEVLEVLFDFS